MVLSRLGFKTGGVETYDSLESVSRALPTDEEIMVIGGGEIYRQCLPQATRLVLSVVQASVPGDAWFPMIQARQWSLAMSEHIPADEANAYGFTVMDFERTNGDGTTVPQFLCEV